MRLWPRVYHVYSSNQNVFIQIVHMLCLVLFAVTTIPDDNNYDAQVNLTWLFAALIDPAASRDCRIKIKEEWSKIWLPRL